MAVVRAAAGCGAADVLRQAGLAERVRRAGSPNALSGTGCAGQ